MPVPALLPAGRKFCKLTQNWPNKKMIGRENWAAVRPQILDKSGRKPAENRPKKYVDREIGG
jgi:hypothetical protein